METYSGVVTTGIYCRPGCPARPNAANVRPFDVAAAAEAAGFRACLRCRPYRSSPPVGSVGPELVCRAVQLILDGALDGGSEAGLAVRLGVSPRHLRRLFATHVGATPDQLARSRRTHFARRLLDDTDLTVTDIAFASGFGSVRQFNRACQDIFRAPPSALRARRRLSDRLVADGGLVLRLPFSGPLDWAAMLGYFAARAVPGVEAVDGSTYRRTVLVDGDPGVLELAAGGDDHLLLRAHLPHWDGLIHVVERARRVFSLDADVEAASRHLCADPVLGPLLVSFPGRRVPGTWDPFETGVRAIVGQQVTVPGATTLIGRIVRRHGRPVPGLAALGLGYLFPEPEALAGADLSGVGLTTARAAAVHEFASAVAAGKLTLDRSAPLDELVSSLAALPGLGPWTANYVALRLGGRDAFPVGDLGLRRVFARLVAGGGGAQAATFEEHQRLWSPWRATAATQLWLAGATPAARRGRTDAAVTAGAAALGYP